MQPLERVGRAIGIAHRQRQLTQGARRLEQITMQPREEYSAWVRRERESTADMHKRAAPEAVQARSLPRTDAARLVDKDSIRSSS